MKDTVDVVIKYYEKGEVKETPLTVKFVSNKVSRDFGELMKRVGKVKDDWDENQELISNNAKLRIERPEDWKAKIEKNDERLKEIAKSILNVSKSDFFQERFEIMKRILEDNGIKDETLLSFDFWDENVDPTDMMDIMASIIYKDLVGVKKKDLTPSG